MSQPLDPTESVEVTSTDNGYQPSVETPDSDSGGNPAWNGLLEKLPAEFHNLVRPELEKWDKNFQEMTTKYKPYEDFVSSGIEKDHIMRSLNLYQNLSTNPQGFYEVLGQRLGITAEQAQQVVEDSTDEDGVVDLDDNVPDVVKKQLEGLSAGQEQMRQYIEAEAHRKQVEAETQAIDEHFARLREKHGTFNEKAVMERAMLQMANGQSPDLDKAFAEYQQFVNEIRQTPTAGQKAPIVMPTGGGVPGSGLNKPVAEYTEEDRAAAFKAMLDARR